ncbi:hypothetical protein NM688_g5568 [Phlebia brevispora]|uniref:Uncharacterized protein n=1 Tax=Phlebia brevispora TaxID=194682 RepID=A0ACC1ST18_9APHY|nr:hypothetical protein NM688_g5568 [Phlebia brevispora]
MRVDKANGPVDLIDEIINFLTIISQAPQDEAENPLGDPYIALPPRRPCSHGCSRELSMSNKEKEPAIPSVMSLLTSLTSSSSSRSQSQPRHTSHTILTVQESLSLHVPKQASIPKAAGTVAR